MRRSRKSSVLFFFIYGFLVFGVSVSGEAYGEEKKQQISWIEGYNKARITGTASDRPVLLFLTTDGCRHCVRMERDAFKNQTIVRRIRQSFVAAKLHLDSDSKLAEQLKITIYPTTIIIHPDGKILDYARGYLSSDELGARMATATRQLESRKSTASTSVVRK